MGEYSREYLASRVAGMSKVAADTRCQHSCHAHAMGKTARYGSPYDKQRTPVDYSALATIPGAMWDAGKALGTGAQAIPGAMRDAGKALGTGAQAIPGAMWDAGKALGTGAQAIPGAMWDANKEVGRAAVNNFVDAMEWTANKGFQWGDFVNRNVYSHLADSDYLKNQDSWWKVFGTTARRAPLFYSGPVGQVYTSLPLFNKAFKSGLRYLAGDPSGTKTEYTDYPWHKTVLAALGSGALVKSLLGGGWGGGYPMGGYPMGGGASGGASNDKVKAGAFTSRLEAAIANQGVGGPMRVVDNAMQNTNRGYQTGPAAPPSQDGGNPWVA